MHADHRVVEGRAQDLAPRLGQHSVEVLREAGLAEDEIERMLAAGETPSPELVAQAGEEKGGVVLGPPGLQADRAERLALAGLHLGDVALVQENPAHELHVESAQAQRPLRRLAAVGEGLRQQNQAGAAGRFTAWP